MNKAVIGTFSDSTSASRAINDLKAYGFGGETVSQVLREELMPGQRLPGPRVMPGMEVVKGLVVGAIIGAILGAIAYWVLKMTLTWPLGYGLTNPLLTTIVSLGIVGAVCGLIEGCIAAAALAAARHHLMMRRRADAMVTVYTDDAHTASAERILREAGAWDVRRGASSVSDEFRTVESVQPETYGERTVVTREPVVSPAGTRDEAGTTTSAPDGGAVG